MASQTLPARNSVDKPLQPQSPNVIPASTLSPPEAQTFYDLKERCRKAGFLDLPSSASGDSHAGINDDFTLLRFLRARKFDVDGAYAQFQQARELHQAKRILEEYDSIDVQEYDDARKLYPHWTGRRDKRGLPICFFDISHLDPDTMKSYVSSKRQVVHALAVHDGLTRFALPLCAMAASSAGNATLISSCLYIVDISSLGLKQAWSLRQYVQNTSKLLATSYPEVIDRVLIIGAPSYFPSIWGWIKGWIDPVTAAKLSFVAPSEVLSRLSEFIELDNIPKQYGGNFDCSHGMQPALDDALSAMLSWPGSEIRELPAGPLKWLEEKDGTNLLMAVGNEKGGSRRQQIAVMEAVGSTAQTAFDKNNDNTGLDKVK